MSDAPETETVTLTLPLPAGMSPEAARRLLAELLAVGFDCENWGERAEAAEAMAEAATVAY